MRDIVCRGVESIQPKLAARGQHIHVDLPADAVPLHGDDARLVQVLHNLLDNASKFSPLGGRIDVGATIEGPVVAIRVTDRGVGIARDALETIFDLFEQEGGAGRRPTDGFGAWSRHLPDVRRTARRAHLGRKCRTRSRCDAVRLPIDRIARATRGDVRGPVKSAQTDTTPLRIVIVDDNRDSADTLAVLLQVKARAARRLQRARRRGASPATTPRS